MKNPLPLGQTLIAMKSYCEEIHPALHTALRNHDVMFLEDAANMLSIVKMEKDPSLTTITLVCPKSRDFSLYGPKNGTELSGLSYFEFKVADMDSLTHFIFPILNLQTKNYEFGIIPAKVLIERHMSNGNSRSGRAYKLTLQLWLLPDGLLFDTNGIGVEGERFMIQGRMAKDTNHDYSEFLNNWVLLK